MNTPTDAIHEGTSAEYRMEIAFEQTVKHVLPHMPAVLGTPTMIMAMEEAARIAIEKLLPPGWLSVGFEVCIRHLAAARAGETLVARATVTGASGKRIRYKVSAQVGEGDSVRLIGEGTHERAAIDSARFNAD